MPLNPATKLGPYEIVAPLGAGGMGEVYRAHDTRLDRDVAVKVLPPALAQDPDALTRFEREAKAVAALSHPNILAIHDVGAHDGLVYAVTELLDGETLRERVAAGPLPLRKVIDTAVQIAHGLAAAHGKGIVHRDLKPENVFVTTDGRVKILDFGLAKPAPTIAPGGATAAATMAEGTTPGTVVGTVGYMSPEQVRGQTVDHRTDIFAFGAVLYEMVSGRRAFKRDTPADTMSAILSADPPELTSAASGVPPALDRIIRRCLEKNPGERFHSAHDLGIALETISSVSTDASSPGAMTSSSRPRARTALAALGLVMVGAAASAALLMMRAPAPAATWRLSVLPPDGMLVTGGIALTRDGRLLAFTAAGDDGVTRLYLRPLDAPDARVLRGTEGALDPFWSPDGRALGFFADGQLKRVNVAGGDPQILASVPDPRGGSWSADGTIIFAPHGDGIYRVPSSGGAPVLVTKLDAARQEFSHRWPEFLPDGRHFLFMNRRAAQTGRDDRLMLAIASLDDTRPKLLAPADSSAVYASGHVVFLRGRTLFAQPFDVDRHALTGDPAPLVEQAWRDPDTDGHIALAASAGGVLAYRSGTAYDSRLEWLDRQGRSLGALSVSGVTDARISPDGRLLAASAIEHKTNIAHLWITDVQRGTSQRFPGTLNTSTPIWSPDGRRLAFSDDRAGSFDIFIASARGGGAHSPVAQTPDWEYPESFSPDGRLLLFHRMDAVSKRDLWVQPLEPGAAARPLVKTDADEYNGDFSPDGRWFAYTSRESGRNEVYVQPYPPTGPRWQISTAGGEEPRWRGDAREIFYLAPDNHMMSVAIDGAGADLQVGKPAALFRARFARMSYGRDFDVTAAGDRVLANLMTADGAATAVHTIVNWRPPQ
jgi:Tol biopolymer transport system component